MYTKSCLNGGGQRSRSGRHLFSTQSIISVGGRTFLEGFCQSAGKTAGAGTVGRSRFNFKFKSSLANVIPSGRASANSGYIYLFFIIQAAFISQLLRGHTGTPGYSRKAQNCLNLGNRGLLLRETSKKEIEKHGNLGPRKLLMVGVRDFADLRPKNCQISVLFLRIWGPKIWNSVRFFADLRADSCLSTSGSLQLIMLE